MKIKKSKRKTIPLVGKVLLTSGIVLFAGKSLFSLEEPLPVKEVIVVVEGVKKTKEKVVRDLLSLREGIPWDPEQWKEDLLRLKDQGIFQEVTGQVLREEDGVVLIWKVKDRYSLVPVLEWDQGENLTRIRVGAIDRNFLGRNQTLSLFTGFTRSYGKGTLAGGILFSDRYLFPSWEGTLSLEKESFPHVFYEDISTYTEKAIEDRIQFYLSGMHHFSRNERYSLGFFFVFFSRDFFFHRATTVPEGLPGRRIQTVRGGVLGKIGKIYTDGYTLSGAEGIAGGFYEGGALSFPGTFFLFTAFTPFFFLEPGVRVFVEYRKTENRFYHLVRGGWNAVRGVPDQYFRSQGIYGGNGEIRTRFFYLHPDYLAIQGALFLDGGKTFPEKRSAYSTGVGIRIGVPIVYGLFIRADLAYLLFPTPSLTYYLSTAQFF